MTPPGHPQWTETVLQQLCESGASPTASLIYDAPSNTFYGGSEGDTEYGPMTPTIFTLTHSGGGWIYTPIYNFSQHGGGPAGSLLRDSAGDLYGTTIAGGANPLGLCNNGCGTIFKLTPSNGSWIYTDLYNFTGGSDGAAPYRATWSRMPTAISMAQPRPAAASNRSRCGVIFKFTP